MKTLVTVRMAVLLPLQLTSQGPAYSCGMLARGMANHELEITIVTPRAKSFAVSPANVIEVLPRWSQQVPYRLLRPLAERMIEQIFLEFAARTPSHIHAAYVFP